MPSLSNVAADFRIDLVQAVQHLLLLRRRVVDDVLVVDRARYLTFCQVGSFIVSHMPIRLQAPLEQPLRLALLRGDQPDDVFAEARGSSRLSTSVTKPYLYSRVASCSMVSVDVDICSSCQLTSCQLPVLSACQFETGDWQLDLEAETTTSDTETRAAPARALGVRVVEDESLAHEARVVVERRAVMN